MKTKIEKTPELIWVANYSEHDPLEVTLPTPSLSVPLRTLRETYKEEIERIQKVCPGRKLRIKKRLWTPPKEIPNHVSDLTGHLNAMERVLGISPESSMANGAVVFLDVEMLSKEDRDRIKIRMTPVFVEYSSLRAKRGLMDVRNAVVKSA